MMHEFMEKNKLPGKIKWYTVLVFLVMFLIINGAVHIQVLHHKNEEELKATYTAEATVRRIESQLNRYLTKSALLKRIIKQGCTHSDEEFDDMAALMIDDAARCSALSWQRTAL